MTYYSPEHCLLCSYLSHVRSGLINAMEGLDHVVFADVCKQGQHPFGGHITDLQSMLCVAHAVYSMPISCMFVRDGGSCLLLSGRGALPKNWQCVTALPTYNPLGSTVTFTNQRDIVDACLQCLGHSSNTTAKPLPAQSDAIRSD